MWNLGASVILEAGPWGWGGGRSTGLKIITKAHDSSPAPHLHHPPCPYDNGKIHINPIRPHHSSSALCQAQGRAHDLESGIRSACPPVRWVRLSQCRSCSLYGHYLRPEGAKHQRVQDGKEGKRRREVVKEVEGAKGRRWEAQREFLLFGLMRRGQDYSKQNRTV